MQVPPMVSALKKDGRRLYELAREGVEVEREARPVSVYELEILEVADGVNPDVTFRVVCGKGTYVRSLADDLARAMGGFAHLTELRRTSVGGATVGDAIEVDELGRWPERLLAPNEALSDHPAVQVDEATAANLLNGIRFEAPDLPEGPFRVVGQDGTFLAMCEADDGMAVPVVVFN